MRKYLLENVYIGKILFGKNTLEFNTRVNITWNIFIRENNKWEFNNQENVYMRTVSSGDIVTYITLYINLSNFILQLAYPINFNVSIQNENIKMQCSIL